MWSYLFKSYLFNCPSWSQPALLSVPLALCQAGNPGKHRADRQIKLPAAFQTEQTVTNPVPEHKDNDVMLSPSFAVRITTINRTTWKSIAYFKDGNKPQSTQNRGFVKNLRTTKDLFFISIELPRNIGRTLLCPWVMKLLIHDESGSMGVSQNEIIPFFIYPSDNSVNETE